MADLDENAQDSLLDAALNSTKDDDAVLGDISADPTVDDSLEDPELEAIKARVKEMEEEAEKLKEMQKQVEETIMSPTAGAGQPTFPKTLEEKGEIDSRSVYVGNELINLKEACKYKLRYDCDGLLLNPVKFKTSTKLGDRSFAAAAALQLWNSLPYAIRSSPLEKTLKTFLFRKAFLVDYSATAEELEQHFHGCGSVNRVTILCDKFTGHPKGFAYIEFADKDSVDNAVSLDDSLFKGRQIKVNPKRTNRPGISTTDRGGSRGRGRGRGFRGGYYNPYNPYANYVPRPRGRAMFRGRGRAAWYSPY